MEQSHYDILHSRVDPTRQQEFAAHIRELIETEGHSYDGSFLGFIDDYVGYAGVVNRRADIHGFNPWSDTRQGPPLTVIDVGCAAALQHVLFNPEVHYIGIDSHQDPPPRFFRDNCTFIKGRFAEVAETLTLHEGCVGIANMSLLYLAPEELALFDRCFRRKFVW